MNQQTRLRLVAILLPWVTLRRIRSLAETTYECNGPTSDWDRGYDRFAFEVLFNMGRSGEAAPQGEEGT